MFFPEIVRLSGTLLSDEDDMVRKGLAWLLRETAKADVQRTVPSGIANCVSDTSPRDAEKNSRGPVTKQLLPSFTRTDSQGRLSPRGLF
jgi:3-methyladenine DNA glycosylase AlkD